MANANGKLPLKRSPRPIQTRSFSIGEDLRASIRLYPDVNWSAVVREALATALATLEKPKRAKRRPK